MKMELGAASPEKKADAPCTYFLCCFIFHPSTNPKSEREREREREREKEKERER